MTALMENLEQVFTFGTKNKTMITLIHFSEKFPSRTTAGRTTRHCQSQFHNKGRMLGMTVYTLHTCHRAKHVM